MNLTGYSRLRPLPPAGDAARWALTEAIHTRKEIFHDGHPADIQRN
jgi:hypothetical protein